MSDLLSRILNADIAEQRDLLEEAFSAIYPYPGPEIYLVEEIDWSWDHLKDRFRNLLDIEAYMSAAELLVPEGLDWLRKDFHTISLVHRSTTDGWATHIDGGGPTPALALAYACLKEQEK